jgi:hypothetical protein
MPHVVTLTERDIGELRMIVADKDRDEALRFLKERVLKPLELSERKGLDVSRGRP